MSRCFLNDFRVGWGRDEGRNVGETPGHGARVKEIGADILLKRTLILRAYNRNATPDKVGNSETGLFCCRKPLG